MKLTKAQFRKISDISSDIAQVSLASVVIPFLLDQQEPMLVLLGIGICTIFWSASLYLAKNTI